MPGRSAGLKPSIFIGWDSREDIAFQVCEESIRQNTSVPVNITSLRQKELRAKGLYWREPDSLGSTEFTFTRFLVPHLMNFKGWALFCDCDFVFLEDVARLFEEADDQFAVMCVQHDYNPSATVKMDNKVQHLYPRKNWSSLVLWNCGHPSNRHLTLEYVNSAGTTGKDVHRFSWLRDEEIGSLDYSWNWLVGWYSKTSGKEPRALHYTEGGPWFDGYRNCEFALEWYTYARAYLDRQIKLLQRS